MQGAWPASQAFIKALVPQDGEKPNKDFVKCFAALSCLVYQLRRILFPFLHKLGQEDVLGPAKSI